MAAALALCSSGARAAEISVIAIPVALDPNNPERTSVGPLQYRGGLRLVSSDIAFGGLSGIRLSADGTRLLAISDRAMWFQTGLRYEQGVLVGLEHADLMPIRDAAGRPLIPPRSDAESFVRVPGGLIAGYERAHRLVHYNVDANGAPSPNGAYMLPSPPELQRAPLNGGLESLTVLADGRLLAITEALDVGDGFAGWIIAGDAWEPLRYVAAPGFNPTDATTLPNGDVLVLERRFTLFERAARILRIRAADIQPGARLVGTELARIAAPLQIDNFEGIDAIADPAGGIRLFLVSDDNFGVLQRTLLLQFWMPDPAP
jgi:hypothetical protein